MHMNDEPSIDHDKIKITDISSPAAGMQVVHYSENWKVTDSTDVIAIVEERRRYNREFLNSKQNLRSSEYPAQFRSLRKANQRIDTLLTKAIDLAEQYRTAVIDYDTANEEERNRDLGVLLMKELIILEALTETIQKVKLEISKISHKEHGHHANEAFQSLFRDSQKRVAAHTVQRNLTIISTCLIVMLPRFLRLPMSASGMDAWPESWRKNLVAPIYDDELLSLDVFNAAWKTIVKKKRDEPAFTPSEYSLFTSFILSLLQTETNVPGERKLIDLMTHISNIGILTLDSQELTNRLHSRSRKASRQMLYLLQYFHTQTALNLAEENTAVNQEAIAFITLLGQTQGRIDSFLMGFINFTQDTVESSTGLVDYINHVQTNLAAFDDSDFETYDITGRLVELMMLVSESDILTMNGVEDYFADTIYQAETMELNRAIGRHAGDDSLPFFVIDTTTGVLPLINEKLGDNINLHRVHISTNLEERMQVVTLTLSNPNASLPIRKHLTYYIDIQEVEAKVIPHVIDQDFIYGEVRETLIGIVIDILQSQGPLNPQDATQTNAVASSAHNAINPRKRIKQRVKASAELTETIQTTASVIRTSRAARTKINLSTLGDNVDPQVLARVNFYNQNGGIAKMYRSPFGDRSMVLEIYDGSNRIYFKILKHPGEQDEIIFVGSFHKQKQAEVLRNW